MPFKFMFGTIHAPHNNYSTLLPLIGTSEISGIVEPFPWDFKAAALGIRE